MNIEKITDWTHKDVRIIDIRKNSKMYILLLDVEGVDTPVTVQSGIFDEQLVSYFMCDTQKISRDDILSVRWNMVLSKGYYIKIDKSAEATATKHFSSNSDKWFVSYLKVSGELGTFDTIYR